MRRSKSYEVRDPMNIWNKYDFAMSGLGKKSKILAKIKHFFKCVKWSKQRITRGYYADIRTGEIRKSREEKRYANNDISICK